MAVMSSLLFMALLAAVPAALAQTAQITISVVFATPPASVAERSIFGGAFRNGFAQAVNLAGCVTTAPILTGSTQSIAYTATGASISFTYSVDPSVYTAVALVVSSPAEWFSQLDQSQSYTQNLIRFLDPSPPGGFYASSSIPYLTYPADRFAYIPCSTPPPPYSTPVSAPPPPCGAATVYVTIAFQATTMLGNGLQQSLRQGLPAEFVAAMTQAGAVGVTAASITSLFKAFNTVTSKFTVTFALTTQCNMAFSSALTAITASSTYYLLQATPVGAAYAVLGTFSTAALTSSTNSFPPPPPASPPTPVFASPPPPFLAPPSDLTLNSQITFTGSYATVAASLSTFTAELQAALAGLFCTSFASVTVGAVVASGANIQTTVQVLYSSTVTPANATTCGAVNYVSLQRAFAGTSVAATCYQRLNTQDTAFGAQWNISAGVCITSPLVPATAGRRLIEAQSESASLVAPMMEPAAVIVGTDKMTYEMFGQAVSYSEAVAVCASRQGSLASYKVPASKAAVHELCGDLTAVRCWVEGTLFDRCSAADGSRIKNLSCKVKQHFVCIKVASA